MVIEKLWKTSLRNSCRSSDEKVLNMAMAKILKLCSLFMSMQCLACFYIKLLCLKVFMMETSCIGET